MTPTPKFQEEYSAKLPALALLCNLGWEFMSTARQGCSEKVVSRFSLLTRRRDSGPIAEPRLHQPEHRGLFQGIP